MKKHINKQSALRLFLVLPILFLALTGSAQEIKPSAPQWKESMYVNPTFIGLMIAIIFMMILILALNEILKSILHHQRKLLKTKNKNNGPNGFMIAGIALLVPQLLQAQETTEGTNAYSPVFPTDWYGLSGFVFWPMVLFLIFEVVVAIFILNQIKILLHKPKKEVAEPVKERATILDRFNASVSIEKEHDILLDHNYDGIQELDNDLPPWWKYGFYVTIVAAFIYMAHYHLFKTGDLQLQEFLNENIYAEQKLEEYKKRMSGLVDENTVVMLTDETSINEGKKIYADKCVACHGSLGEGTAIAPNLTDNYWIHGGSIKDVFTSIKYGWTEKGMRSWQDELNARQMHVLSSYVMSLQGSNPPNAKEKQGELYIEEGLKLPESDSLKQNDTIPE